MPDKKISQLVDGGASQALDAYVIARTDGVNYKIAGTAIAAAATSVGTLTSLAVTGDLTVDTSTLKVDSTNNRVGVGTASPDVTLDLEAAAGSSTALVMLKNTSGASASNIAQMQFWSGNTFGGLEQIASIHGINPNAGSNNGGTLVFSTSSNGTATTPTERMRLDASGNLGLGAGNIAGWDTYTSLELPSSGYVSSGVNWMEVMYNTYYASGAYRYKANGAASHYLQQNGAHSWHTAASGTAGNTITFTQAMTLNASGNLSVNSTGAVNQIALTASGTGTYTNLRVTNANSTAALSVGVGGSAVGAGTLQNNAYVWNTANSALSFGTNDTERARITSGGELFIGTTAASGASRLVVAGSGASGRLAKFLGDTAGDLSNASVLFSKFDNNSTTSQVFLQFAVANDSIANGQINANGSGAVAFGSWSDVRLKNNVVDLSSQWDNVKALRPVEFDYIEEVGGGHQIGFIAQEVREIYPDVVGERADGMLILSGMSKNEARLIKALQEAMTRIESLEARLAALES